MGVDLFLESEQTAHERVVRWKRVARLLAEAIHSQYIHESNMPATFIGALAAYGAAVDQDRYRARPVGCTCPQSIGEDGCGEIHHVEGCHSCVS